MEIILSMIRTDTNPISQRTTPSLPMETCGSHICYTFSLRTDIIERQVSVSLVMWETRWMSNSLIKMHERKFSWGIEIIAEGYGRESRLLGEYNNGIKRGMK